MEFRYRRSRREPGSHLEQHSSVECGASGRSAFHGRLLPRSGLRTQVPSRFSLRGPLPRPCSRLSGSGNQGRPVRPPDAGNPELDRQRRARHGVLSQHLSMQDYRRHHTQRMPHSQRVARTPRKRPAGCQERRCVPDPHEQARGRPAGILPSYLLPRQGGVQARMEPGQDHDARGRIRRAGLP